MEPLDQLETEIKKLMIDVLMLEDLVPEDIDSTQALFGEGLGLDSIDALEIAMVLEQQYGIESDDDEAANRERYASVRNLARYVNEGRRS